MPIFNLASIPINAGPALEACVTLLVESTPPANVDDLQNRIIREIDLIRQDPQTIRRAVSHACFKDPRCTCIDRDGGHVEDLALLKQCQGM